jgi:phosphatidylglycerol lysyltransferase
MAKPTSLRGRSTSLRDKALRYGKPALAVLTLAGAAWFVHREVHELKPRMVLAAVRATTLHALVLSALLTVLSYGCLSVAEWALLRYIGRPLPARTVIPRSLAGHALASNLGFGLLTGAAVRFRLYKHTGLSDAEITGLSVRISTAIFASGFVTLGLALLFEAFVWPRHHVVPFAIAGVPLLAPAAFWFFDIGRARKANPDDWARWLALLVSIGDWIASGAALFVLTGHGAEAFPAFFAVFLVGSLAGSLAGIPAAVGVLDAAVLGSSALSHGVHESAAALLIYRLIYFLAPLGIAALGLVVTALVRRSAR